MPHLRLIIAALFLMLLMPHKAWAVAGDWQKDDDVAVRLIAGVDGVGEEKFIPLGLDIQLAPDWHTYWRSPGDAGLPPQIDWRDSLSGGNLQKVTLLYPAPKRYSVYGLETIGYRDHVVLPIEAELRMQGQALKVSAALSLLVCNDICVPKHFDLKLTVPTGPAKESTEAMLIHQYRALVPKDAENSGLSIKKIVNDGRDLTLEVAARFPMVDPDLFVEDNKNISFGAPIITIAPNKLSAQFRVSPTDSLPEGVKLAGLPLTFTVTDRFHALEQTVTVPAAVEPALLPPSQASLPFGLIILFAVIGGFILNLMPCVLPVLSLKVLSVISHGGGEMRLVRHSFLTTAAGIMFSYWCLAGVTLVLKEAGRSVGWGVQFQQPIFLVCLVLLLTFFAASMWGLFEIKLPRFLADNLDTSYHPKLAGDFATGAFATLLATPCSAPFLGTAIGFALASGPREIMIVFTALGFGMILPYLLIALFPRFATALPKPGRWMVTLRVILGWALALTALWLIWVLAAEVTAVNAAIVALSVVAILGLLGLKRLSPLRYLNFGILSFAVFAFGVTVSGMMAAKPEAAVDAAWQTFNERTIARDVSDGKTVFVDVTADWCLTCKANMKLVLSRSEVAKRLFSSDLVVPMQANWTNPDPVIASFLRKYGRYGIPFNVVFGPAAPEGLVLPELLTKKAVLEALDSAEKRP